MENTPDSPTTVVSTFPHEDTNQPPVPKAVAFGHHTTDSSSVYDLSAAMSNMSVVRASATNGRMVSTPPPPPPPPPPPGYGSPQDNLMPYIPREIAHKESQGGISTYSSWGDVPTVWGSSVGGSPKSRGSTGEYLDDPHIAPPPVLSFPKERLESQAGGGTTSRTLPRYDYVRHSGYIMTRFSAGDLLTKKWCQNFWILYGERFYFFNSKEDFEVWLLNPNLTSDERAELVNFRLSLFDQATLKKYKFRIGTKNVKLYQNNGNMHRFKLTKHAKLGITRSHVVAGAFASLNEVDVTELYGVMNALMKRGPSASPPSSPAAASYNSYYDNSSSQYL